MIKNKKYKLKIGASRVSLKLVDILNVIDASELTSEKNKQQIDRHDVAECILETHRPIAFDLIGNNKFTGRFVIVDDYEIAGAGIIFENIANNESILKDHVRDREFSWTKSAIPPKDRASVYGHGAKFIVVTGDAGEIEDKLATALEKRLFINNFKVYYLRATNIEKGLYSDLSNENDIQDEYIIRLGELARIITDSGLIFIISISDIDDYDLKTLELLNQPNEILVVNIGKDNLMDYDSSLNLDQNTDINNNVEKVCELLKQKKVILEYCI